MKSRGYNFELIIKKEGNPFENVLTLWLNEECTTLNYKMKQNPKIAYQLDFSYLSLPNSTATEAIERYLNNRTNGHFTDINGHVFFYVLMVSDTHLLDDFLAHPFTFRVLAERIKRGKSVENLIHCNRHTLLLSCLAEHIGNLDESLADEHQAFIKTAWFTPAIYRWLQSQPLYYVERRITHSTFYLQYQADCLSECSLFIELLRLSIKQRNWLLSQHLDFASLLGATHAYGRNRCNYKLLKELPLSELVRLQELLPWQLESYISDITTMMIGATLSGCEYTRPTTAKQVVKLHDALLLQRAGDAVIGSNDFAKEILENKRFPVFPITSLNFVEPISCIAELREEGVFMNHCIYSSRYIEKLLSGNYFAYRVTGNERATLLLVKAFGVLEIEQISGYSNSKVSRALVEQIKGAIASLGVQRNVANEFKS